MKGTSKTRIWLQAIRLRTLPLALASIGMGSFLAGETGHFDIIVFLLCALTTTLLQILSNLANDYGDFVHGADSKNRLGPRRAVQSGLISPRSMRLAIYLTSFLALFCGITLLYKVFHQLNGMFAVFLFMGLGAIGAALGYTLGKKPYGYTGLGDLFVMIFFGPVGVLGTYFLHTGTMEIKYLLPALCSGFLATSVLNVNNIRDIESDTIAGKHSVPVRLGREKAISYHIFLIATGFITAIVYDLLDFKNITQFIYLFTLPLFVINIMEVKGRKLPADLDPSLRKLALSILLFTILFGTGLLVSGF